MTAPIQLPTKGQPSETQPLTLLQRLNFVANDMPVISKAGQNKEQNYKYIEASAIAATLRELFAKHGVFLKSEISKVDFGEFTAKTGTKGEKVVAWFNFTFINCFDKDDSIRFEAWPGVAMDYSDKALNKAMTAAQKTFLMKQFLVSDIDPDLDSPEAVANQSQPATQTKAPAQASRPAPAPAQTAKPATQSAQPDQKEPSRLPDITKDEFGKFLKEMGITSAQIAETLSGGKQKTFKDWADAYKTTNPNANIKNWLRFGLHEYTVWLEKNKPDAGWLWDNKTQLPRQLEDVPFEEIPDPEDGEGLPEDI